MNPRHVLPLVLVAALAACSSKPTTVVTDAGAANSAVMAAPSMKPAIPVAESRVAAVEAGVPSAAAGVPVGERLVYFGFDSFSVEPDQRATIEANAQFLRTQRARRITVEGHTDEQGGREYNLALGQQRADSVRRALGLLGVAESQVETVSFGEERPAAAGSGEESFARNRRAEIRYP